MKINDIFGSDPQQYGIFPGRFDDKYKNLPPFTFLRESFNTHYPVRWESSPDGLTGYFSFNNIEYEIYIEPFEYNAPPKDKTYNCINIGFAAVVDGQPTTDMVSATNSQQVLSIITNAINTQIVKYDADAIIIAAGNNVDSRLKLYNRLIDRYGKNFGVIYKNIKTPNGTTSIVIGKHIPDNIRQDVYNFIINQTINK